MKPSKITGGLLFITASVLSLYFLWSRYQLGQSRFFDVDELAYLHWASHYVHGSMPYRDFLFFIPPGYLWFLAPIFVFVGGITPFFVGRALAFGAFLGMIGVASWLFWEVRRSWAWIVIPLVLAFLPLPSFKFLEIRPDTLATLLALLGLVFEVRYLRRGKKLEGIAIGASFALALLVLPKSLPIVIVGMIVLGLAQVGERRWLIRLWWVGLGFLIPSLIFLFWLLSRGTASLSVALYLLLKFPFESAVLGKLFSIQPNFFFYPNVFFYGAGDSRGLYLNHALWLAGFLFGTYRLLTPFLSGGKREALVELLLAGSFWAQIIFFFYGTPFRHAQYLIPIATFVVWYLADGVFLVWQKVKAFWWKQLLVGMVFIGLGVFLYRTFNDLNQEKLIWKNTETLATIQRIFAVIPNNEYILDLEGAMLYYPDPYYACCLPFGQFAPFLSRPLPSLTATLTVTKTKYIFQGKSGRVNTLLPEDQLYVQQNFVPWEGSQDLLVRKNILQ